MTDYRAFPCESCGGAGSVLVHGAEDYGVSFGCEQCEQCGGAGVDVPVLQAAYRGAVDLLREVACSGVEHEMLNRYVTVQIDRVTWDALAPYRTRGQCDVCHGTGEVASEYPGVMQPCGCKA